MELDSLFYFLKYICSHEYQTSLFVISHSFHFSSFDIAAGFGSVPWPLSSWTGEENCYGKRCAAPCISFSFWLCAVWNGAAACARIWTDRSAVCALFKRSQTTDVNTSTTFVSEISVWLFSFNYIWIWFIPLYWFWSNHCS